MILIKKGNSVLKVSKAAYKDMFKNMGYEIVKEGTKDKVPSENKNNSSKNDKDKNSKDLKASKNNLPDDEEESLKKDSESKEDTKKDEENNLEDMLGILSNNEDEKENKK